MYTLPLDLAFHDVRSWIKRQRRNPLGVSGADVLQCAARGGHDGRTAADDHPRVVRVGGCFGRDLTQTRTLLANVPLDP